MKHKQTLLAILNTLTFVLCVVLVGLLISACQSNIQLSKISLPSKDSPLINKKVTEEDFAYPTKDPSIEEGKKFFVQHCSSCHGFNNEPKEHKFTLKYINTATPSHLFKTITNNSKHQSFKDVLTVKERWDVVMYLRFVLFGLPEKFEDIKIKFGSNCAVCHGTRGFGDGDIHYFLNPPPANFNQFDRLYEKTDEKLFDEISYGIPWTAMPPWENRVDKDKKFTFDEKFRWELVKYVRQFGYTTEKDLLRSKALFKRKEEK